MALSGCDPSGAKMNQSAANPDTIASVRRSQLKLPPSGGVIAALLKREVGFRPAALGRA
jgi:hypothetical protein